MAPWQYLWEQLQAERSSSILSGDDLVDQIDFLRACVEGFSSTLEITIDLIAIQAAVSEVQRELQIRQRNEEARIGLQNFLNNIPLDAHVDPRGVENGMLDLAHTRGLRRLESKDGPVDVQVLYPQDIERLLSNNVVHNNYARSARRVRYETLPENVHDRSLYRNPEIGYHELMQGCGALELPHYHDIHSHGFTNPQRKTEQCAIEFSPELDVDTWAHARHLRRRHLKISDSTHSQDSLKDHVDIPPEIVEKFATGFVLDPRTKHSSNGARQLGVLRSTARTIRKSPVRQSMPTCRRPMLTLDTTRAQSTRRRSLTHVLDGEDVDHAVLSAQISPIELLGIYSTTNQPQATRCLEDTKTSSEQESKLPSRPKVLQSPFSSQNRLRTLSTKIAAMGGSCDESGIDNITNDDCNSISSPAFSWAESLSIEVASMSERRRRSISPCYSHRQACKHQDTHDSTLPNSLSHSLSNVGEITLLDTPPAEIASALFGNLSRRGAHPSGGPAVHSIQTYLNDASLFPEYSLQTRRFRGRARKPRVDDNTAEVPIREGFQINESPTIQLMEASPNYCGSMECSICGGCSEHSSMYGCARVKQINHNTNIPHLRGGASGIGPILPGLADNEPLPDIPQSSSSLKYWSDPEACMGRELRGYILTNYRTTTPPIQSSEDSSAILLTSERERAQTPPHGFRLSVLDRREGILDWRFEVCSIGYLCVTGDHFC